MQIKKWTAILTAAALQMNTLGALAAELVLPAQLLEIGEEAFAGAQAIDTVVLPENITRLGSRAFAGSTLRSIHLPHTLLEIADDVFEDCGELNVTADEGSYAYDWAVENGYIAGAAAPASDFAYTVVDGASVSITGYMGTETEVAVPATIEGLPVTSVSLKENEKIVSVTLPETVTELPDYAFAGCVALERVTLPDTLRRIGVYAFRGCTALEAIVIPEGVAELPGSAFGACTNLRSVSLPGSLETIGNAVFTSCSGLEAIVIPEGVKAIGINAFASCTNLRSISLPDSLQTIGSYALSGCTALEEIAIPEGVTELPGYLFLSCSSLKRVTLPDSLETIKSGAFQYCEALEEMVLPEKLTTIGSLVFEGSGLKTIRLPSSLTAIEDDALEGCGSLTVTAEEGTYAYDWAVENGYIVPEEMQLRVHASSAEAKTGERVTWTAEVLGGTAPVRYLYKLWRGEELIEIRAYQEDPAFTHTFTKDGSYCVEVSAKDNDGEIVTVRSEAVTVTADSPAIGSVTCSSETIRSGDTATFTAEATGGQTPLTYAFALTKDGETVAQQEHGESSRFTHTFDGKGDYTLTVEVRDDYGAAGAYDLHISVAAQALAIASVDAPAAVTLEDPIVWTVNAVGGEEPLTYAFDLFVNGEEMDGTAFGEANTFTYQPEQEGTYAVRARVRDADGVTVERMSAGVDVYTGSLGAEFTYHINNGTVRVSGYKGTEISVVVPAVIRSLPVTSVSLSGNTTIVSVTLPEGVTELPYCAFQGCTALESVVIPESVTTIDSYAFRNCNRLKRLQLPDGIEDVGYDAFLGCSAQIFCRAGTKTAENVSAYGKQFVSPTELDYILSQSQDESGALWLTITSYQGSGEEIAVPAQIDGVPVRAIGGSAFRVCESIRRVSLPEGIETIGSEVFAHCYALEEITIPESMTQLPDYAFTWCERLARVNLPDNIESIGTNVFHGCPSDMKIFCRAGTKTADTVNAYGKSFFSMHAPDYAFRQNRDGGAAWLRVADYLGNETEITLPSQIDDVPLREIGYEAFASCAGLKRVILPEGIETIDNYAFRYCSDLETITIPESMKQIGSYVFADCDSMKSIVLPEGMRVIGSGAFSSCAALNEIVIPESVKQLPGYIFNGCTGLERVGLPAGIETIGSYAFYNCTALESVAIPENVKEIGSYAFASCTGLKRVNLPQMLASVGAHAFRDCAALSEMTIPKGVTQLPERIFYACSSLEYINLPDDIEHIGADAFSGCPSSMKIFCRAGTTTEAAVRAYGLTPTLIQ